MFFDDKKKIATVILSKRNSKGEKTMDPTPVKAEHHQSEPGEVDGKHVASEDVMGALHSQSPSKFTEAMSNFIDLHMHSGGSGSPQGGGD